jgi:anti-anti-sigma factor
MMVELLSITATLSANYEIEKDYQLFQFCGIIDAFSEKAFDNMMSKYITKEPTNLILDLSKIEFIDSAGVGTLVRLAKSQANIQIVATERIAWVIKILRLEQLLSLRSNVDDAIQVFQL